MPPQDHNPREERAGNQQTTTPPDMSLAGPMCGTHRLPSDTDPAGQRGTGDTAHEESRGRRVAGWVASFDVLAWRRALDLAAILSLVAW